MINNIIFASLQQSISNVFQYQLSFVTFFFEEPYLQQKWCLKFHLSHPLNILLANFFLCVAMVTFRSYELSYVRLLVRWLVDWMVGSSVCHNFLYLISNLAFQKRLCLLIIFHVLLQNCICFLLKGRQYVACKRKKA